MTQEVAKAINNVSNKAFNISVAASDHVIHTHQATEQMLTDIDIEMMEQEQDLTDMEIAIMELQDNT